MSQLVGYGFRPTDEELVNHYLKLKNQGKNKDVGIIAEVDICRYEPWDLPDQSKLNSSDQVWYFFGPRDHKYRKGKQANRKTSEGSWKSTGNPRKIVDRSNQKKIGTKRSLVFYRGRPSKETRTRWIMQQYECATDSNSKLHDQGNFVLYKVEKKPDEKPSKREPNQSTAVVASDLQNHQDPSTNSVHQDWCLKEANAMSNDETSHSIPSSFENLTFIPGECTPPTVIPSDFELQSPCMEGGCLLTSNFEKQMTTYREGEYHPMVTPNSNQTPCGKGDWILDLDIQNQISPHVKGDSLPISGSKDQISVGGDSKHSPVISFDFRSKLPYDIGDCLLTSDFEDPMSDIDFECLLTSLPSPSFDSEDKSTYEKDNCLKASDLENPISDIEFEEREQNYLIPRPSCLEDLSTLYEGEPNSLWAYDFKKISSNEKANISVSGEGDSSFLKATPSDFANQNQFQKTDMQNLDVDWDFLNNEDVESVLAVLDLELTADPAEPQGTLNSELQESQVYQ